MLKTVKRLKPWHMGTHLRVLNESYPMNTNMIGLRWFSFFFLRPCALDEGSHSIGRVKVYPYVLAHVCASVVSGILC